MSMFWWCPRAQPVESRPATSYALVACFCLFCLLCLLCLFSRSYPEAGPASINGCPAILEAFYFKFVKYKSVSVSGLRTSLELPNFQLSPVCGTARATAATTLAAGIAILTPRAQRWRRLAGGEPPPAFSSQISHVFCWFRV